jgi:hypothetical protein
MSELQTISIVLGGIGLFIAAINSVVSSRKADQQRQMELFTQLYSHVVTEQFSRNFRQVMTHEVKDVDDWMNMPPEMLDKGDNIHRLIVYMCVVINKGLIDIELVDDLIARRVIDYWKKIKPFTMENRRRYQDPTLGDDIEAAYRKLKRRRDQQVAIALQQQATIAT